MVKRYIYIKSKIFYVLLLYIFFTYAYEKKRKEYEVNKKQTPKKKDEQENRQYRARHFMRNSKTSAQHES